MGKTAYRARRRAQTFPSNSFATNRQIGAYFAASIAAWSCVARRELERQSRMARKRQLSQELEQGTPLER